MKNSVILSVLIFIISLLSVEKSYAYNQETHVILNDAIVKSNNIVAFDMYLIDHLGMESGISTEYEGMSVEKTVSAGGKWEDEKPVPVIYSRSYQHFHDPTKPLSDAGYKGSLLGISKEWDSSIIWALSENGQSSLNLGDYSFAYKMEARYA